ncbi:speedy protein A [Echinococcus multilocularis]|uniref:Speedy protein A n=1 Tax=Echinococcus multilocularis TaxID=6211 RepID=A0A0S4MIR9_ECHMU|nr:speedy protein A [Echinococcus multilocularis]
MDDTSGAIPTLFSYPRKSFGYNDSGTDGVYSQDGESYVDNEISYEDETWLSQETFTSDNNFGLITAKNKEESFVAGEE